jgi:phosphatidylglycerophosphatase A
LAILSAVNALAVAIATGLGSGFFPVAPATFASALVVAAVYFLWPASPGPEAMAIVVLAPLAVWSAGAAERRLGHDAHPIVVDEVVGQLIALWALPRTLVWLAAAFLLFRLFDIWKPLGAHESQRLPGGWGIVADDLLAGIYARLVLQAALLWGPALARAAGV